MLHNPVMKSVAAGCLFAASLYVSVPGAKANTSPADEKPGPEDKAAYESPATPVTSRAS
jgi:hypothetical protein